MYRFSYSEILEDAPEVGRDRERFSGSSRSAIRTFQSSCTKPTAAVRSGPDRPRASPGADRRLDDAGGRRGSALARAQPRGAD
jgi:hypothetical protein